MEGYATALSARREAQQEVHELHEKQNQSWQTWRERMVAPCEAVSLVHWQACDQRLTERRADAERILQLSERAAGKALEQMLLARREREAVQKYLEKQRREYGLEVLRQEQKTLDEFAQRRNAPAPSSFQTTSTHS